MRPPPGIPTHPPASCILFREFLVSPPFAIKPAGVDFLRHREPLKIVLETSSLHRISSTNTFKKTNRILFQCATTISDQSTNHLRVLRLAHSILDTPIFGEFDWFPLNISPSRHPFWNFLSHFSFSLNPVCGPRKQSTGQVLFYLRVRDSLDRFFRNPKWMSFFLKN